jgi:excisionase family DNA binding protein
MAQIQAPLGKPEKVHRLGDVEYFKLDELARYSGLSARTLRNYIKSGHDPLPHYRFGRRVLVRKREYDAWAEKFRFVGDPKINVIVDETLREFRLAS